MFWERQLVEMWPRVLFQDESKISSSYNELGGEGGSHLQTTPAQGGTEIEKRLLLLAFERLSQLTLTLLCYQLVRPNKIKQSFKCVSSVDIIFKIILRYLFFYYRILFLIVVYILTISSCDLLTLLGMSFFLAFIYSLWTWLVVFLSKKWLFLLLIP